MNEIHLIQFHLSTCLAMMLAAGVTVVPAVANERYVYAGIATFWIFVAGVVREEWMASE